MFQIARSRCDECLFSKNRIVDEARAAQIVEDCLETERHFVCHKFTIADEDSSVCCKGFWDKFPDASAAMQVAQRLGFCEYVDFPAEKNKNRLE